MKCRDLYSYIKIKLYIKQYARGDLHLSTDSYVLAVELWIITNLCTILMCYITYQFSTYF